MRRNHLIIKKNNNSHLNTNKCINKYFAHKQDKGTSIKRPIRKKEKYFSPAMSTRCLQKRNGGGGSGLVAETRDFSPYSSVARTRVEVRGYGRVPPG